MTFDDSMPPLSALPFLSSTAIISGVLGVLGESGFSGGTGNIGGGATPETKNIKI